MATHYHAKNGTLSVSIYLFILYMLIVHELLIILYILYLFSDVRKQLRNSRILPSVDDCSKLYPYLDDTCICCMLCISFRWLSHLSTTTIIILHNQNIRRHKILLWFAFLWGLFTLTSLSMAVSLSLSLTLSYILLIYCFICPYHCPYLVQSCANSLRDNRIIRILLPSFISYHIL